MVSDATWQFVFSRYPVGEGAVTTLHEYLCTEVLTGRRSGSQALSVLPQRERL